MATVRVVAVLLRGLFVPKVLDKVMYVALKLWHNHQRDIILLMQNWQRSVQTCTDQCAKCLLLILQHEPYIFVPTDEEINNKRYQHILFCFLS